MERSDQPRLTRRPTEPPSEHQVSRLLAAEREHLRRDLHELRQDMKKHSLGLAIAGGVVAAAASVWGVAPAALAGLSAYVVFRVMDRRLSSPVARVMRRVGLVLKTRCPECGETVTRQVSDDGARVELRCSHGHSLGTLFLVPRQQRGT